MNTTPLTAQEEQPTTFVTYRQFGAKGDGITDDFDALRAAHNYANLHRLTVQADAGATYYMGGASEPVRVETDVDFGDASFLIDDREVVDHRQPVFDVCSTKPSYTLTNITTLQKRQTSLPISLPEPALVIVENDKVRHFIRRGLNQNSGVPQKDIFLVDTSGQVSIETPIQWDFDHISSLTVYPIDEARLTLRGGRFITRANHAPSQHQYHQRGFRLARSNTLVADMQHFVTDEGETGAPYNGFIRVSQCAHVEIRDTLFTGRKTYTTVGAIGKPMTMGSYDLLINDAANIQVVGCRQTNDINDSKYWGIMGSNHTRNLLYDNNVLSRFDAHMGVVNATIRNSTLGYMRINAIGGGRLLVENSTVKSSAFICLRPDYGSSWEGELIIRDCIFAPPVSLFELIPIITAQNDEQHDFGYPCMMPERITIENLRIDDTNRPDIFRGITLFSDVHYSADTPSTAAPYPYRKPQTVILRNVTCASGNPIAIGPKPEQFSSTHIEAENCLLVTEESCQAHSTK